jgi:hypothetical protein
MVQDLHTICFLILHAGLLNYKWSQTGIISGIDQTIASLHTALLLGAGVSYYRIGDKTTAVLLSLAGALQGMGASGAVS